MKKMLFTAIAMVAFSVNSSAQILDKRLLDVLDCLDKADKYLKSQEGWSMYRKEYADLVKNTFYAGCMEGKKKDNGSNAHTQQKPTISK